MKLFLASVFEAGFRLQGLYLAWDELQVICWHNE